MVCISCKNSYNVLSLSGDWGEGGGVMQKRESPDLRFPGFGISAASVVPWLMASHKVPMDLYVVVNFLSRVSCIFSLVLTSLAIHLNSSPQKNYLR